MRASRTFPSLLCLLQASPIRAWADPPATLPIQVAAAPVAQAPAWAANAASILRNPTSEPPFNLNETRISNGDLLRLNENRYRLQADGTILPPDGGDPIIRSDMQGILYDLVGRQKLKALLQLNLIFNRFGYKNLPESAQAEVRRISRQNWAVLPKDIRSDLKQYFTPQEMEGLMQSVPKDPPANVWKTELPKLSPIPSMPVATFVAPPPVAIPTPVPATGVTHPALASAAAAPSAHAVPEPKAAVAPVAAAAPAPASSTPPPAAEPPSAPAPLIAKTQPALPSQFPSLPPPQAMQQSSKPVEPASAATTPAPIPATTASAAAPAPLAPNLVIQPPAAKPAETQQPPLVSAAANAPAPAPARPTPVAATVVPAAAPSPRAVTPAAPAATEPLTPVPSPVTTAAPALAVPTASPAVQAIPSAAPAAATAPLVADLPAASAQAPASPTVAAAMALLANASKNPNSVSMNETTIIAPAAAAAPVKQLLVHQPVTPPTPPAPVIPDYPDVSRENFDRYLKDAPYGHETADLLKLISDHSAEDIRRPALGVLMRYLPQIVIDPVRSGAKLRAETHKLNDDPYQPASTLIVLNRGPVIVREHSFLLFGARNYLLPVAQDFYGNRGVLPPPLQAAATQNAATDEKKTDWGDAREYPDGSRRLVFSKEELAGTLLAELLKLDARLRRWDVDRYHAELRSRSAEFRFFYQLGKDSGKLPRLSPDLKVEYAEWLEMPADYIDFVLQALASPKADDVLTSMSGSLEQRSAWSRRHDLKVMSEAGLTLSELAQKTLSEPAPSTPDLSEANEGLKLEVSRLGETSPIHTLWLTEEQRFREALK